MLLALVLALVVALAPSLAAGDEVALVGEPHPDLRLPTLDGGTLSISSLRGRKVLLIEFASW